MYGPAWVVFLDPRDGRELWRTRLSVVAAEGANVLLADQEATNGQDPLGGLVGPRPAYRGGTRRPVRLAALSGSWGRAGPVLGFTHANRTWLARVDLARATVTVDRRRPRLVRLLRQPARVRGVPPPRRLATGLAGDRLGSCSRGLHVRPATLASVGGDNPVRVLVVEDETNLADAIVRGLRREGMAVDVAYDGTQGHEMAYVTRYDVVVLDRDLPASTATRSAPTWSPPARSPGC
jgi:hypothetical protein